MRQPAAGSFLFLFLQIPHTRKGHKLWAAVSVGSLRQPVAGGLVVCSPRYPSLPLPSGFLHKDDFNALPWHLLALIAGGNALGLAVHESGLLEELVSLAFSTLDEESPWLLTVELVSYT